MRVPQRVNQTAANFRPKLFYCHPVQTTRTAGIWDNICRLLNHCIFLVVCMLVCVATRISSKNAGKISYNRSLYLADGIILRIVWGLQFSGN